MSHPAASIKSIFSGKVNFNDTDLDDSSTRSFTEYSNPPESDYGFDFKDSQGTPAPPNPAPLAPASPGLAADTEMAADTQMAADPEMAQDTEPGAAAKYLRLAALHKSDFYPLQTSSTNISLASSTSDYQQAYVRDADYSLDLSQVEVGFSRPWSRNSNASCLSTTATKDGIEGKRHHRLGPFPYAALRAVQTEDLDQLGPPVTLKEKIGLLSPEPRPPR